MSAAAWQLVALFAGAFLVALGFAARRYGHRTEFYLGTAAGVLLFAVTTWMGAMS